MKFQLIFVLAIVLTACGITPDQAAKNNNMDLCTALATKQLSDKSRAVINNELSSRRADCTKYAEAIRLVVADQQKRVEQQRRIQEAESNAQRIRQAESAREIAQLKLLCEFCGQPGNFASSNCKGVSPMQCGSMWGSQDPEFNCYPNGIGGFVCRK